LEIFSSFSDNIKKFSHSLVGNYNTDNSDISLENSKSNSYNKPLNSPSNVFSFVGRSALLCAILFSMSDFIDVSLGYNIVEPDQIRFPFFVI
jgi:hypothetical protein